MYSLWWKASQHSAINTKQVMRYIDKVPVDETTKLSMFAHHLRSLNPAMQLLHS